MLLPTCCSIKEFYILIQKRNLTCIEQCKLVPINLISKLVCVPISVVLSLFLVCKTTICLGKYEGKKTTVKKMYENIGLLELRGPLAPLFYIGLWGAFFLIYLLLEGEFTQAPRVPGQKNILLWPGVE